MLALQGPALGRGAAPARRHAATPSRSTTSTSARTSSAGVPCLIARTGYTGEPGRRADVPLGRRARPLGRPDVRSRRPATPAGLVARDTLRLEMGYPLYGQELSRERTPIEAGLRWACDIAGRPLLRRRHAAPPGRGGHRRAPGDLPPDRAGHPARRAGRGGGRPPGRHASPAGRSRRRSTSASAWPTCRPPSPARTTTWSSTCAGSRRPPAPPAARSWRHPRRSEGDPVAAEETYPDRPPVPPRARLGEGRGRRGRLRRSPGTPRTRSARSCTTTRRRWAPP